MFYQLGGQPKKQSCLSTLSWHDKHSALTTFSPGTVPQPSPRPKVLGHENDGADVFGQHTIYESPTTRMRYKPPFLTQPALRYNELNHRCLAFFKVSQKVVILESVRLVTSADKRGDGRAYDPAYPRPSPRSFALVPPTFTFCPEALKTPFTRL